MEQNLTLQILDYRRKFCRRSSKGVRLPHAHLRPRPSRRSCKWKDVIAKAPTGTGKTFAFGIPMLEHIDP